MSDVIALREHLVAEVELMERLRDRASDDDYSDAKDAWLAADARLRALDGLIAPRPMSASRMAEAMELLHRMHDLSAEHFDAGWHIGLELALWNGMRISARDLSDLHVMAESAGGWWVWRDGEDDQTFVTLAEWAAIREAT